MTYHSDCDIWASDRNSDGSSTVLACASHILMSAVGLLAASGDEHCAGGSQEDGRGRSIVPGTLVSALDDLVLGSGSLFSTVDNLSKVSVDGRCCSSLATYMCPGASLHLSNGRGDC